MYVSLDVNVDTCVDVVDVHLHIDLHLCIELHDVTCIDQCVDVHPLNLCIDQCVDVHAHVYVHPHLYVHFM